MSLLSLNSVVQLVALLAASLHVDHLQAEEWSCRRKTSMASNYVVYDGTLWHKGIQERYRNLGNFRTVNSVRVLDENFYVNKN